jgi:hypothetical protein
MGRLELLQVTGYKLQDVVVSVPCLGIMIREDLNYNCLVIIVSVCEVFSLGFFHDYNWLISLVKQYQATLNARELVKHS